ncbi:MAG: mannonate dehydratase [Terracidiphilus sp.]
MSKGVVAEHPASKTATKKVAWPVLEGPDTPKLTQSVSANATPEEMRMHKQFGDDYVLMGGPRLPWTQEGLRAIMDRFQAEGLTVINMMLPSLADIIYARPGRDEQIAKVQDSLRAAGAAGLPIVEYNFYGHRLTEGYYNVPGRGGTGYLGYDYNRQMTDPADDHWTYPKVRSAEEMGIAPKDLAPLPDEGPHTSEELWSNITYFLKAVIPVAEKANVRMALHPNDPPAPVSRGTHQIMNSFSGWKRLVSIVDSPSNGMTFDCGVSNELGEDPLEVLKYLADRDRINHVHYRNDIVEIPSTKYVEVFPDNGTVNMFAVMRELVRRKYKYGVFPEHPRKNAIDDRLGGDFVSYLYNLAYARAMLQACLTLREEKG